jgi:hypothetical protein
MTKTSEVASGKTVAAALALDAPRRASSMGWNSTLRRLGALGLVASAALFAATARAGDVSPPGENADIGPMCGMKPMIIGRSDGFGGNTWRKTVIPRRRVPTSTAWSRRASTS